MTDNLTDFKQQVIDLRSLVHTLNMQRMKNHGVVISPLRRLKGSEDFFIFNRGGEIVDVKKILLILAIVVFLASLLSGAKLIPISEIRHPCLIVTPQVLLFTHESRHHEVLLVNMCTKDAKWNISNPSPAVIIDVSSSANPIPPHMATPIGVRINWDEVPIYSINIENLKWLDWVTKITGIAKIYRVKIYFNVCFFAVLEGNWVHSVVVFIMRPSK